MSDDDFHSNRFHRCALAAGFLAAGEGRLCDSVYVKRLAYHLYESGAFREPERDHSIQALARSVGLCQSRSRPAPRAPEREDE